MIADERLDLNKYIGYSKPDAKIKTNFGDQYRTDASTAIGGQYPWDPGRFNTNDILNRAQARKRSINAQLGYVDPHEPLDTQLFIGLGRFTRHTDYDFNMPIQHPPKQSQHKHIIHHKAGATTRTTDSQTYRQRSHHRARHSGVHQCCCQCTVNTAIPRQKALQSLIERSVDPWTK